MIEIESVTFGKLQIPREGFDRQDLFEAVMEELRKREGEYRGEKDVLFIDKHSRILVELASKVGWIETMDASSASPKKIRWIAEGIAKYIADCLTVDPN